MHAIRTRILFPTEWSYERTARECSLVQRRQQQQNQTKTTLDEYKSTSNNPRDNMNSCADASLFAYPGCRDSHTLVFGLNLFQVTAVYCWKDYWSYPDTSKIAAKAAASSKYTKDKLQPPHLRQAVLGAGGRASSRRSGIGIIRNGHMVTAAAAFPSSTTRLPSLGLRRQRLRLDLVRCLSRLRDCCRA